MFNIFKKKPLLTQEAKDFQIDCFKWLLTYFGGDDFYKKTELILPTQQYFPLKSSSPDSLAIETFEKVKAYACMEEWPCVLEVQEKDPEIRVAPTVILQNVPNNPLGTFEARSENEIVITYNPRLLSNPIQLVATFAHELSHYLTATAPEPPPGGMDNWEYATDICATFLGFGVFVANAAFTFQQYSDIESQGWSVSGGGYLSEEEHSYALAIFLHLRDINPERAYPHCDTNIKAYLKRAFREINDSDEIGMLKSVKYIDNS
ncbi:hypothetical protein [Desulfogranum japonicum]|uniref:hypothetical protein n=1 Tax=Desulfogranum japonicum TaxID=231447 RepID=UPI000405F6AC|nr:hypothetical protein [Desulfogranum japonicum]